MNILITINQKYIKQVQVLLKSIERTNPKEIFNIYILHKSLTKDDEEKIKRKINPKQFHIQLIKISQSEIEHFPVYEKRYPIEIYFRIFATKYLSKDIDRILYLDTDIVVMNSLKELYNMDFENNYFIATTHIKKVLHKFHEIRLNMPKENIYMNTGVLLMNLKELRKIDIEKEVNEFVNKNKRKLMLPDQDILSTLYGDKVKLIEEIKYNLGERSFNLYNLYNKKKKIDLDWIRKNTVIIHYYGRNKPWNKKYIGKLNRFYNEIVKNLQD